MKIIFVGICNKPGKKPLDMSTHSGKIINTIIMRLMLSPEDYLKTNLCDTDVMPHNDDISGHVKEYFDRVGYNPGDIFVLLGSWVHKYFPRLTDCEIIKIQHPASFNGTRDRKNYVDNAVTKILVAMQKGVLK